jgi:hypothetical protein
MKTTSTTAFIALSKIEIKQLTYQVAETLATDASHAKSFTAANLWNIQRGRRTARVQRRHMAF